MQKVATFLKKSDFFCKKMQNLTKVDKSWPKTRKKWKTGSKTRKRKKLQNFDPPKIAKFWHPPENAKFYKNTFFDTPPFFDIA